jgi:hypothetical protein
MTAAYKKILILLSLVLLIACQEVYNPDDIDAGLKIPVIEGYLHDGSGPYRVELFWAAAFYDRSYTAITDALVTISDDYGNTEILTETGNGRYYSDKNGIRGTAGRIYTLHVELPDGSIYESVPVLMPPVKEIDTIYAEPGEKEYTSRNLYGELMIHKEGGLYVYVDMNSKPDDMQFFRFYSRVVSQSQHYLNVTYAPDSANPDVEITEPVDVYCWSIWSLSDIVNVKSTVLSNNEQVIRKHNLGFLPYIFNPAMQDSVTGPSYPSGWIVTTTAYSIPEDAYEYYNSIVTQLSAEERIFDPVPFQITGNIHCLSDTGKLVLGLFEVASKTSRHTAFNWSTGRHTYNILNLPEYFAPTSDACQDTIMPDFWITFQ